MERMLTAVARQGGCFARAEGRTARRVRRTSGRSRPCRKKSMSVKDPKKAVLNLAVSIIAVCLPSTPASAQENDDSRVAELIRQLSDQDASVRANAAEALGEIGPEAKAAVPALIEASKHEEAGVRANATYALGRIGSDAKAAVPALIEKLKDENAGVR